ncbi:hypothetical protein WMW72_35215 [Paenibacillus filicis]|uniref:Uncharacterized protein n=1 Tax=Paenibacillus filicis TaxID=669464 RepID=A0ABU9DWD6_9BACL
MRYDFEKAKRHREQLVNDYRLLKHVQDPDGTWDWWIKQQIAEIDRERIEAHQVNAERIVLDFELIASQETNFDKEMFV